MNFENEQYDFQKILPMLRSFGVSPENLGPDKLDKLQKITQDVKNPSDITQQKVHEIMDIFGIDTIKNNISNASSISKDDKKQQKVGRNFACTCGSGQKYKKCCGKTI
jgi:hypothetical protein